LLTFTIIMTMIEIQYTVADPGGGGGFKGFTDEPTHTESKQWHCTPHLLIF